MGSFAKAEIMLLGEAQIAGDASDMTGLAGQFEDGVPFNRFGGISAIDHLAGDQYVLLSDRGSSDGAVPYATRFHLVTIKIPETGSEVSLTLIGSRFFTKESGQPLVGAAKALKKGPDHPGRFDPEGIRAVRVGGAETRLAVSDEYGPRVDLFDMTGSRVQKFNVPKHFEIKTPSGNAAEEAMENKSGRQPNGGFEGLAVSPDGTKLYAMLQRPLVQDGAMQAGRFAGRLNRILRIEIATEATAELVYPLDSPETAVSELLCVDEQRALVLERDSISGLPSRDKRISIIDWDEATDVSQIKSLPSSPAELPTEIRPVGKRVFLDLLDPRFGIAGESMPAKFEGLTFGPNLADGRKTLLVTVDNDFQGDRPTRIFVFAVSPDEFEK